MKKKPNIFLFIIDAIRYDVFPFFGYRRQTAPFLNGLMKEGSFFPRAFSSCTWTLPVHLSYLCGLSTFQHTVDFGLNQTTPYPNSFLFLPQLLAPAGYKTMLMSDQLFLVPKLQMVTGTKKLQTHGYLPPCNCGFDYLEGLWDYMDKTAVWIENQKPSYYWPLEGIASRKTQNDLSKEHQRTFNERVRKIDPDTELWPDLERLYRQSPYFAARYRILAEIFGRGDRCEDPFFAMINIHSGQLNFEPEIRKRWFQEYFKLNLGIEVAREDLDFFDLVDSMWVDDTISMDTWELLHAYDLMFMDCSVRLLCEYFREKGMLTQDDYFIFTVDHGLGKAETNSSPRNCHHGAYPFDWLVHVPFFVSGPGFDRGRRVSQAISVLDVYPTIVAMAQAEIPADYRRHVRGLALQERLDNHCFQDEVLIESMIYVNEQKQCVMPKGSTMHENWNKHNRGFCLVNGDERFVCIPDKRIVQLFDCSQDRLYEQCCEEPARMAAATTRLQAVLENQKNMSISTIVPMRPTQIEASSQHSEGEDRVVASLKALGYY